MPKRSAALARRVQSVLSCLPDRHMSLIEYLIAHIDTICLFVVFGMAGLALAAFLLHDW